MPKTCLRACTPGTGARENATGKLWHPIRTLRVGFRWYRCARPPAAIASHLDANPELQADCHRLCAISGVGLKTARWLCAELPRHLPNSRAAAAWCGLTPRLRQSGTSLHGTSSIGHEGHRFPRKESSVSFRISTPGLRLSRGGDSRVHPRVLPLRALTGVFKPIGHFVIAYQAAAAERLVVVHTLNARHADVVSHKRTVD